MKHPRFLTHMLCLAVGIGFGLVVSSITTTVRNAETTSLPLVAGSEPSADPVCSTGSHEAFAAEWASVASKSQGSDRTKALRSLLLQGVHSDLAKAWSAALSLSDPEEQLAACRLVLAHAGRINPHLALSWLAARPDAASQDLVEMLAPRLPADNLEDSIKWVSLLPDRFHAGATALMVRRWSRKEPVETARLINSRHGLPEYDGLVRAFSLSRTLEDPAAVMQWSRTISDKQLRCETQMELLKNWERFDPLIVRKWIHNSSNASATETSEWQDFLDEAELTTY